MPISGEFCSPGSLSRPSPTPRRLLVAESSTALYCPKRHAATDRRIGILENWISIWPAAACPGQIAAGTNASAGWEVCIGHPSRQETGPVVGPDVAGLGGAGRLLEPRDRLSARGGVRAVGPG